MELGFCICG